MSTKLETGLRRLKTASHGPAVQRYAKDLLARLGRASNEVYSQVVTKLDAPRPASVEGKIVEDEQFAVRQALKSVRFEVQVGQIFDSLRAQWRIVQTDYYRGLWAEFAKVFRASAPSWASLEVRITRAELASMTSLVQGMQMVEHIRWLQDKTLHRIQSLVQKAYVPVPKAKKDYRATYKDALRGAMDGMMRSIEGLLRGLFEATYEQAQSRFLAVLNG
jgi:hypothetical protein